jgi:hypothetical protein
VLKRNSIIELDDVGSSSVTTEAFLAQIHRSTELMRENRSDEAKQILEAAFEARMDDPSSHATLALVYFKLGIYPRALAIYRRLVRDFPNEPTLRLNLGLVYLKTGQTKLAVRQLETVVQLTPEYRKAQGYLGLAYQRMGDYLSAKQAFEKAGANHLAKRMNRFIEPVAENTHEEVSSSTGESGDPDLGSHEEPEEHIPNHINDISEKMTDFVDALPVTAAAPTILMKKGQVPQEPLSVGELAAKARIPEPLSSRFLVSEAGYLLMNIETQGFTRLAGLHFLVAEQISYKPIMRRYRGQSCDELFGEKENPMFSVTGVGQLGFHPKGQVFGAVSLDGEAAFIREKYLFAMDSNVSYENGRIPGDGDILVHLSGRGAVVIQTPSEPKSLEVTPKKGVIIPGNDLVGWFGRLLPRPTPKGPFDPALAPLEIVGEGVVLFCLT